MVPAGELWDYFSSHRTDLANNYHMIASDEENGVEIYLTEDNGFPCFTVEVDGCTDFESQTSSEVDAENTYGNLLDLFIAGPESYDEDEEKDDIRIHEIFTAARDFLEILLEEDPSDAGVEPWDIDELVSAVEERLFYDMGISVRHPAQVNGKIVQYPFGDPSDGS